MILGSYAATARAEAGCPEPAMTALEQSRSAEVQVAKAPEKDEILDESVQFLGMGRSSSFPFPQFRANDRFRTVFFDAGKGHPLVFVHGLGGNATHWEYLARAFVHNHRVVGLDAAGCGWNLKPDQPYTIDLLRDHLLAFLDERGIKRATLVGHSLGGAICLSAAFARPGLVDSLVLVGAAGIAPLPRWMRVAAPFFLHRKILVPLLAFSHSFILDKVFVDLPDKNPYVRRFMRSALRDEDGFPNLRDFGRVCETLCRDVIQKDYSSSFDHLVVPVLGIWGEQDHLVPLSSVLKRLSRIRRVRTVVLGRCGHMPMIERPEETIFHISRFLKDPP